MLRARVRLALMALAATLLAWALFTQAYELAALAAFGLLFILYGYFREGTVILAAKAYHNQDFEKAEQLLNEIANPDRLARRRRGYYEFILGNIELKRNKLIDAERHFQIASRFPFKSENEKALVLVQLANLNLAKRDFVKCKAYIDIARELKSSNRVKSIIENIEKEIRKGSE